MGIGLFSADEALADHVVVSWHDNAAYVLDDDMAEANSLPVGVSLPNAVATDGTLVYCGFSSDQLVVVYDFEGVEQFRFDVPPYEVQGLELVGDELAVGRIDQIDFYDPESGAYIRTIEGPGDTNLEGLGFDGDVLWVLDDTALHGIDPIDGGIVETLPNAAQDCEIPGTGVSSSGDGQLTLVCTDGRWFVVSSDDGSVISSGDNGIDMWGSDFFKGPECGDEFVDRGEACDTGGESVSCDVDCTFAACGDGVWNPTAAEECDDSNLLAGDGCSATCTLEASGTDEGAATSEETSTTAEDGDADSTTGAPTTDAESTDGPEPDTSAALEETAAADTTDPAASGCGCASTNGSKNAALFILLAVGALGRRRRAQALP